MYILPVTRGGPLDVDDPEVSLGPSEARPLGVLVLAARTEPTVHLPLDVDRQTERVAAVTPRHEREVT